MKTDSTLTRQNGGFEKGVNDSSSEAQNSPAHRIAGVNLEWSQDHARTSRMGVLSYFAHFLGATGLFEDFVAGCPLFYMSNNAPNKRDVLGATLLSVLEGHSRYAHMSSLANAELDARTLSMGKIPCEDRPRHSPGHVCKANSQNWSCFRKTVFPTNTPSTSLIWTVRLRRYANSTTRADF